MSAPLLPVEHLHVVHDGTTTALSDVSSTVPVLHPRQAAGVRRAGS